METYLKNIIRGFGSILDIAPRTDYSRFIPKETPTERMRSHWQSAGDAIARAVANVKQDSQQNKSNSSNSLR